MLFPDCALSGKGFGEGPEFTDRHVEVTADGGHHVTGDVGLATFDFPDVIVAIAKIGRDSGLGKLAAQPHFGHCPAEHLAGRTCFTFLVCSEGFRHILIVS